MKKIFAMLLALTLVLSMLPMAVFAAEGECNHSYNTNNPNGKCTKCGAYCDHPNGFQWQMGSWNRKCNTCGTVECANNGHTYPTTNSDGRCTKCRGLCSHTTGNMWQSQSAFNNGVCSVCQYRCTHEAGYTNNKCNTCKMDKPACQHTYSSTDGKCSKCGETCKHNYNKYSPNGKCTVCQMACAHTKGYDYWNKCNDCGMAKCNGHEYENGVCKNCGYVCGHGETQVIPGVDATCGTPGSTPGVKCKICNVIRDEPDPIPATGIHNYTEFVGYKDGEEPTCTTPGVKIYKCATCTDTNEVNVTAEHKEKILSKQEATCSQEGYIFYTCEECHKDWHDTFEKLPHTEQPLPSKAATCNETGLTAGKKCSVCQEVLVKQVVLAKLEHVWRDVSAKAATCTANGNNAYKECNLCHATLNKEIIPAAHDFSQNPNQCAKCGARNPGCQHTNASITTTKEATCKATGTQTFKCNDCGDTYVETLPKLDYHNYVNGTCTWCQKEACSHNYTTVTAEATCTEKGYTKTYCTICGKVSSERSQNALGHNWNNDVVHNFCTRCGVANPNAVATDKLTGDLQDIFTLG